MLSAPLRTASTTMALRRATQRVVPGGGKSIALAILRGNISPLGSGLHSSLSESIAAETNGFRKIWKARAPVSRARGLVSLATPLARCLPATPAGESSDEQSAHSA